jgi:hypothetical protein
MATRPSDGITQLLERWSNGEEKARDELMPLVYDELHRLAVTYLRRERREHTLQPTALVNELFLKFSEQHSMSWQNRAQFFGVAAQLMRRIPSITPGRITRPSAAAIVTACRSKTSLPLASSLMPISWRFTMF